MFNCSGSAWIHFRGQTGLSGRPDPQRFSLSLSISLAQKAPVFRVQSRCNIFFGLVDQFLPAMDRIIPRAPVVPAPSSSILRFFRLLSISKLARRVSARYSTHHRSGRQISSEEMAYSRMDFFGHGSPPLQKLRQISGWNGNERRPDLRDPESTGTAGGGPKLSSSWERGIFPIRL